MLKRLLAIVLLSAINAFAQSAQESRQVPGVLLVKPAEGVSSEELRTIYEAKGGKLKGLIERASVHEISVPPKAIGAIEKALRNNPKIKYVERNAYGHTLQTPNDPHYASQWHLPKMGVDLAWEINKGSTSAPIAILDTGFDVNNADIAGKFIHGYNAGNPSAPFGGYSSCSGWAHGTWVASVAASSVNNAVGGAGVGWLNPIIPVSVFDSACAMSFTTFSNGLYWAVDHGAKVISISVGWNWSAFPQTLFDAVTYAVDRGTPVVVAAGNDSTNCTTAQYPCYPGSFPNVINVAGTDINDAPTSFSNYGSYVSIAAPGLNVVSTGVNGAKVTLWGTSFSAPLVAGAIGLVLTVNPSLTPVQVRDLLKQTAFVPAGWDARYGAGRLDVLAAVNMARGLQPMPRAPSDVRAQ